VQLNLKTLAERPGLYFPGNGIVTRRDDGSSIRHSYREFDERVRRLSSALASIGVKPGDRVATLIWNNHEHLELYFAVPCAGACLHTANLRLSEEHIAYTINHAGDKALFFSPDLLPLVESIAPRLATVQTYVLLGPDSPDTPLSPLERYDELISRGDQDHVHPDLPEETPAGICFTSATTGNPKGVVYTHRGIYLHSLMLTGIDTMAVSEQDIILPVAPMFHVNSWGVPFAGVWAGADFVMPGTRPTAEVILDLIEANGVTFAYGAVTIGIDMLRELNRKPRDISSLRALMLGGQATPAAVMDYFQREHGVPIFTAWGATETAPVATTVHIKRHQQGLSEADKIAIRVRQGLPAPGIELKVLDAEGHPVPWDDNHVGEALARGPWTAVGYLDDERSAEGFSDGWWKSGDMATVDKEGILRLVDRAKDLIKSGGEWISSVDLENALMAHDGVLEAAVIAMPDEKWLERPIAFVVKTSEAGGNLTETDLIEFLAPDFAKWWLPDRVVFIDAIPKTGVGKFNKRILRNRLAEFI